MAEPGLGGWLWEERANVVPVLRLLATAGFSLLSCLFFYVPWLGGQLGRNPTLCERKARQLMQPRWVALYRGWLVAALDRLDRWMGRPEEWGRGFGWCLAVGL